MLWNSLLLALRKIDVIPGSVSANRMTEYNTPPKPTAKVVNQ